jgi:hypothetical protein
MFYLNLLKYNVHFQKKVTTVSLILKMSQKTIQSTIQRKKYIVSQLEASFRKPTSDLFGKLYFIESSPL